jgi:hypothetical protein
LQSWGSTFFRSVEEKAKRRGKSPDLLKITQRLPEFSFGQPLGSIQKYS